MERVIAFEILIQWLLLFQLAGCASQKITFQSSTDVVLTARKLGQFTEKGEIIKSNSPIDAESLRSKMVLVDMKDKPPYFWVFYKPSFGDITIRVDDPKAAEAKAASDPKSPSQATAQTVPSLSKEPENNLPRMLYGAFKAVESGDPNLAIQITDQLREKYTGLAMPWIIRANALIQLGSVEDAKKALAQAKLLDPSDAEIDKLLNTMR